jgi:uncharacterized damage-inducible protein DinB
MKHLVSLGLLAALSALAQNPVLAELKAHWKTSKDFTLAVANAMPDADYGFKAAPEEMSFGEMVVHIAQGNGFYCAGGPGSPTKSPIVKPATIDKASAMKVLAQSFDFCASMLGGLKPTDLDMMTGPEGQQTSVREVLWAGFTHTAHHRAQLEVYLRVKGIKPPDYQF